MKILGTIAVLLGVAAGCGWAADGKLKVTATTTMVSDLAKSIGGERVEVRGLMGAGVDPHLYKATSGDVQKLRQADLIFYSGLLLEGKMEELFKTMAASGKRVRAVTDAIPRDKLLRPAEFQGHFDPHVWFDVTLWEMAGDSVAEGLTAADPGGKQYYRDRLAAFKKEMSALHDWAKKRAAELPVEKRILVTSHDAYNYFGRAYGFKVVGLQGISTVTEAGSADMAKMVDFIKSKKVKAIFVESSVPHNTINRISQDAGVRVGGELFSDAMGTPGEKERGYDLGSYEGMVKHNLNTIVEALK